MKDEDKSSIPAYWNLRAFKENVPYKKISETLLFSDSTLTGSLTDGVGPFQFINLVPPTNEAGVAVETIMLRTTWCTDIQEKPGLITDISRYHGGWITDEIVALASLRLGVRIKAGDQVRIFGFHSTDPLGTPRASRNRRPEIFFSAHKPILPNAIKKTKLEPLKAIYELQKLTPDQFTALVRAARQYQNAIWIAESEPELSWLMLVSAVETAANNWSNQDDSPLEKLQRIKPKLSNNILQKGGIDLLELIANEIADTFGATNKFIKFCIHFKPDPPKNRPIEQAQIAWSKRNLKGILNKIYSYRSRALHSGIPFPAPLCRPPEVINGMYVEKGSTGLSIQTLGASWSNEDLPISMNTFHYFVNGVLNKWWDELTQ